LGKGQQGMYNADVTSSNGTAQAIGSLFGGAAKTYLWGQMMKK